MKLELICSKNIMLPILNYVYVTQENCIATNTYAIGCVPTDKFFTPEFIDNEIPGCGMFIHYKDWPKIRKNGNACVWRSREEGILQVCHFSANKRDDFIEVELPQNFSREFPDIAVLLASNEFKPMSNLSFDPSRLNDLCNALGIEHPIIQFTDWSPSKELDYMIKVKSGFEQNRAIGILMPIKIETND